MLSTITARPQPVSMAFTFARSLAVLVVLSGCVSVDSPAAEPTQGAAPLSIKTQSQIIVKFRDPTLDPAQPGYLKKLVRDTGVTLVYVRPMSGGAHVLRVEGAVNTDHFLRILDGLAKRPGVEYAEADRLMRTMPPY